MWPLVGYQCSQEQEPHHALRAARALERGLGWSPIHTSGLIVHQLAADAEAFEPIALELRRQEDPRNPRVHGVHDLAGTMRRERLKLFGLGGLRRLPFDALQRLPVPHSESRADVDRRRAHDGRNGLGHAARGVRLTPRKRRQARSTTARIDHRAPRPVGVKELAEAGAPEPKVVEGEHHGCPPHAQRRRAVRRRGTSGDAHGQRQA